MLTDYTTYNDIRSALGVSVDEIADVTLALETWDYNLQAELEGINAALLSTYASVVAVVPANRTPAQAKFYRSTRLFSTFATANALAASLPMFGPKDISDGKATVSRFADSPYKVVVAAVRTQYDSAKDRLKQALTELNSAAITLTPRAYMGTSRPSYDPVTG